MLTQILVACSTLYVLVIASALLLWARNVWVDLTK